MLHQLICHSFTISAYWFIATVFIVCDRNGTGREYCWLILTVGDSNNGIRAKGAALRADGI
jgi:hypothetical protein